MLGRYFPKTRLRRLRQSESIRTLIRETQLSCCDLICPLFLLPGVHQKQSVASMPGIERFSLDYALKEIEQLCSLGISSVILFPVIPAELKTSDGREAFNPNGLIPKAISAIKQHFPQLFVMVDVALDPYTIHGQDGIVDEQNRILNDVTIDVLIKQALCYAASGVDAIAPSDMMDGRIGRIRQALENNNFTDVLLISYAAKYASNYYAPFRDSIGSSACLQGDKKTYQMDPANSDEALHEVALDLSEGADVIIIKPGMTNLDIIYRVKQKFLIPLFAYQVSGEYSMHQAAIAQGWLSERVILESLFAIKRAGADAIITYFAKQAAAWL
jgi:porphobilinogen synthase